MVTSKAMLHHVVQAVTRGVAVIAIVVISLSAFSTVPRLLLNVMCVLALVVCAATLRAQLPGAWARARARGTDEAMVTAVKTKGLPALLVVWSMLLGSYLRPKSAPTDPALITFLTPGVICVILPVLYMFGWRESFTVAEVLGFAIWHWSCCCVMTTFFSRAASPWTGLRREDTASSVYAFEFILVLQHRGRVLLMTAVHHLGGLDGRNGALYAALVISPTALAILLSGTDLDHSNVGSAGLTAVVCAVTYVMSVARLPSPSPSAASRLAAMPRLQMLLHDVVVHGKKFDLTNKKGAVALLLAGIVVPFRQSIHNETLPATNTPLMEGVATIALASSIYTLAIKWDGLWRRAAELEAMRKRSPPPPQRQQQGRQRPCQEDGDSASASASDIERNMAFVGFASRWVPVVTVPMLVYVAVFYLGGTTAAWIHICLIFVLFLMPLVVFLSGTLRRATVPDVLGTHLWHTFALTVVQAILFPHIHRAVTGALPDPLNKLTMNTLGIIVPFEAIRAVTVMHMLGIVEDAAVHACLVTGIVAAIILFAAMPTSFVLIIVALIFAIPQLILNSKLQTTCCEQTALYALYVMMSRAGGEVEGGVE